ncbi:peptide/nickel transport system substrate-binding protein [Frondihabitans sp. PhB188]|uniref:ABC transporter substrate-binding protein n=1 Tax=Frondihabitans sp. PhB188 TaxID=2485200 RepID=UPI000F47AA2F|nr:ABC transporter substrate-binding protein [Frondihabitans sp. PhB188]ROQ39861.1 peptide/nickel transport system substrate-binding protein [Frondihabitans sp. PhB188]
MRLKSRLAVPLVGAALLAVLSGCVSVSSDSVDDSSSDTITLGTTDKVTALDPAGSWDTGSFAIQTNVYGELLNFKPGTTTPVPDLAESAEFTTPTTYTVKLRSDEKFSNGHALTSSDVKFSFDRMISIADANGPSSLLSNVESVAAPDDTTVVFTLKEGDDQLFPQVLASPAGFIVDEDVFSATKLTADATIVAGNPFSAQYRLKQYTPSQIADYVANTNYDGVLGSPKTKNILVTYYTSATDLRLDVADGKVDIASRALSPTDIVSLQKNSKVTIHTGPGSDMRFVVFNFDTMAFGTKSSDPDKAKALAVRQAIADVVDRAALAKDVYKGTFSPLYSVIPAGLAGATDAYKTAYGDGEGGPDVAKAEAVLKAAGITAKVPVKLQFNTDHYGASSSDEYSELADQLNASGLFTATTQSTLWEQYLKDISAAEYPQFQLGWSADYPDSDNYFNVIYDPASSPAFINNGARDAKLNELIAGEKVEADAAERTTLIEEAQTRAAEVLSTLPLLQGKLVAVSGTDITGIDSTLDASNRFRFGVLGRK